MAKKIVIAGENASYELKVKVMEYLISLGHDVTDVGKTSEEHSVGCPEAGMNLAREIQSGKYDCGIGFCGTGMGISQVLNKYKGIFAALVESKYTARRCRIINDSNVMCLGGWVVTPQIAYEMVDEFLNTKYLDTMPEESKIRLDKWKTEIVNHLGQESVD